MVRGERPTEVPIDTHLAGLRASRRSAIVPLAQPYARSPKRSLKDNITPTLGSAAVRYRL